MNSLIILFSRILSLIIQFFNLGNGSTWPGHLALKINPKITSEILRKNQKLKIILIAGTNGKTTTSKLISHILEKNKISVLKNSSGANLFNGIASTIVLNSNFLGKIKKDVAIFEVDENALIEVVEKIPVNSIILLNLFRDQLDRYGEVNSIAVKWKEKFLHFPNINYFINADDPRLFNLGNYLKKVFYFSIEKKEETNEISCDADSIYCPKCSTRLNYLKIFYSHLGIFSCPKCNLNNKDIYRKDLVKNPLKGDYNQYNVNAASLIVNNIFNIPYSQINANLKYFNAAFGRLETVCYKNSKITIILSKNPTGFNRSIDLLNKEKIKKNILIILNDRIPDGRDISWIWDVDFEKIINIENIYVSGDRPHEIGLRLSYFFPNVKIFTNYKEAVEKIISKSNGKEIYILPTYSAMLDIRKYLLGKKIL